MQIHRFLDNVGICLNIHAASQPRRTLSSSPPWEPQISQWGGVWFINSVFNNFVWKLYHLFKLLLYPFTRCVRHYWGMSENTQHTMKTCCWLQTFQTFYTSSKSVATWTECHHLFVSLLWA
jgi:hypothetical protein